MKSIFLILLFALTLFVIRSEAVKQTISIEDDNYEVDEEVLDELIDDIMKNNGYSALSGNNKCANQGGHCMSSKKCNGIVKKGLCPGSDDNQCCLPKKDGNKKTGNKNTTKKTSGHKITVKKNTGHKITLKKNTGHKNTTKKNTGHKITLKKNTGHKLTHKKNNGHKFTIKKTTVKKNTVKKNNGHKMTGFKNIGFKKPGNKNTFNKCKGGKCMNINTGNKKNCASYGGQCMNPQNCTGTVKTGLCPGGNDNKCCIMIVDNKNTVNKNTGNKNTGNTKTTTEDTSSKDTTTEDTSSKDTTTEDTSSKDTTTEDTSSKDTTTKDTSNTNTDDSKQTTSSSSQNSGNQSQSEFIETIGNYAKEEASNRKKNGEHWILPSVCIAQAALETGWGKSTRMKEANAYFGIKANSDWKGKVYSSDTQECYDGINKVQVKDAAFRAYDSLKDSVHDYFDLICKAERYSGAWDKTDAKTCITAIKNGGYATDPDYISNVMSIINSHDLTKYDSVVTN